MHTYLHKYIYLYETPQKQPDHDNKKSTKTWTHFGNLKNNYNIYTNISNYAIIELIIDHLLK